MKTYPLKSLTLAEAQQLQFRLVDVATLHLTGRESLTLGDLGVAAPHGCPTTTEKIERILADFFDAEAAVLVRGSGSGAIRSAVWAVAKPNDSVLLHDAPIYSTTKILFDSMALKPIFCDFNRKNDLSETASSGQFSFSLVQHARQKIEDSYSLKEVLSIIKQKIPETPVLTDDNYAALKVTEIGVQCGADLSTFSTFKLLGPEGVGCVVGKKIFIDRIHKMNYSGGSQVQGHEAMEALRAMILAPVALAVQAQVIEELLSRLNAGELKGVKSAFIANAQSKVLLVELQRNVAQSVLECCERLGAAPHPVGAESKYEFVPMFYRVSGTFLASDPSLAERMIRINPMRAGADTVIRILRSALKE